MKKIISFICAFAVAFSSAQMMAFADGASGTVNNLAGLVYAPVNAVDMDKNTLSLTIEAEDMVSSTNMELIEDANASGGKAMKFTGNRTPAIGYDAIGAAFPVKPNPDLMVNINIPEITAYQVWARVKTAGETLNYSPVWHRFDQYGKYYPVANSIFGTLYNFPASHPKAVHNTAHGSTQATDVELNYTQYPFNYRLKYLGSQITPQYQWVSLINKAEYIYVDEKGVPDYSLKGNGNYFRNPNDNQYILRNGNREFSVMFADKDIVIDKIYIAPSNAFGMSKNDGTLATFNPSDSAPTIEDANFPVYDIFPTTHKDFPEMKLAGVHPRLFITKEEIPAYKTKLTTHEMFASTWANIQTLSSQDINGLLPENNRECDNNKTILSALKARALMYLIGEADGNHAKKTVKELKNFMSTVIFNLSDGADTTYNTRNIGEMMVTAALVYDWCYDVMTYADREYIITRLKEMATDKETSWPPVRQGLISGHRQEEVIYLHETTVAIATYDEDPEWYNMIMSVVYERMRDIRIFGASSGYDHSAGSYFEARNRGPIYLDKMLHVIGALADSETIFGEDYKKSFDHLIYRGLPNGVWFKDGDDYHWDGHNGTNKIIDTAVLPTYAGETFNNPYLLAEGLQSYVWNGSAMNIIDTFMFDPTDVEIKFMCELPTTYMSTYPMTSMVARTGWSQGNDSPDAMVYMSMHDTYLDGHQHADTGTFQLWYKGMLALNAGYYAYNTHYYHYQSRSIANNVLLVDNHNQDFYQLSLLSPTANNSTNDGGQKNTGLGGSGATLEEYLTTLNQVDENGNIIKYGENSLAYEKAHYIGPNVQTPAFSYLSSDISGAYNYQNGKVNGIDSKGKNTYAPVEKKLEDSGYERSMVFMDLYNEKFPAAFIVYDNVSALSADYDKTWLIHSEEEPSIDGNKTTIKRTQNGLNGKLVNTTMYPRDAAIKKVGGDGNEFSVTGISPVYEQQIVEAYYKERGESVPQSYYTTDVGGNKTFNPRGELNIDHNQDVKLVYPDAGKWRVEISPDSNAKTADDIFLNAMYVTEAGTTEELPMTLVEDTAGKYVGVSVMDRIVTFSKTRDNISDEITLEIPECEYETVYCLITDMAEGKWKITGNNKNFYVNSKGDTGAVDDNTGEYSLCFEVAPGTYTIAPTTDVGEVTVLSMETVAKAQYGDFRVRSGGNLINLTKPTILKDLNSDGNPDAYYVAVQDLVKLLNDGATVIVNDNTVTFKAIGYRDNGVQTPYEFTVGTTQYKRNGNIVTTSYDQFTKPPIMADGNIYMDFTEFLTILKISGSYNKTAKLLTLKYSK